MGDPQERCERCGTAMLPDFAHELLMCPNPFCAVPLTEEEMGGPIRWPTELTCPACNGNGGEHYRTWTDCGWEYDEWPCDACDGGGVMLWMMPSTDMAPWRRREREAKRGEPIGKMGGFDGEF